ncbi:iron ABC transporter ATP-binding protein [Reyranella soli]|uniref:Iron ABC transporter ATP-binding protein n=1 Tax=Reyranella soli TaxID=1230389 RepID=A0A512NJK6_9HYPH|nr:iron ABC transporter ATP-binding protein [Reyranella soli]
MELNVLGARGLSIGYDGRTVAAGIDLTVARGDVLCLLGPNGAGKTTLFKTLLGLLPPIAGDVTVGERPLGSLTRAELAKSMAYVPQAQVMEFAYTVLDLVLMGRTAHLGPFSAPGRRDHERAHAALADLGIADLADAEANRISGGQRQLCLVARALAQDAPLLVMDEPTASLDLGNRLLVLERVRALKAQNYGVVFSTHDPDQARELATTVAVIAGGRLAAYGAPQDTVTGPILSAVYGVDVVVERTESGRHVVAPRY